MIEGHVRDFCKGVSDMTFLLYRKVLLRRTLELKMARTEAGTTSKRCILEEVEAFRSWKIFAKFIIFV